MRGPFITIFVFFYYRDFSQHSHPKLFFMEFPQSYTGTYNIDVLSSYPNSSAFGDAIQEGNTPLHAACLARDMETCQWLVKNGADINAENSQKLTPLQYACMLNFEEIAQFFLDQGALLESMSLHTSTMALLIRFANHNFFQECLRYYKERHIRIVHLSQVISAAYFCSGCLNLEALLDNDVILTEELVQYVPFFMMHANNYFIAHFVIFSMQKKRKFMTLPLDSYRSDPYVISCFRFMEHFFREINKHLYNDIFKDLMQLIPDPKEFLRKESEKLVVKPLYLWTSVDLEVCQYILHYGGNVTDVNGDLHETVLHKASRDGTVDFVKEFLMHQADVNSLTLRNETPLHEACKTSKGTSVINVLIDYGANIEWKNFEGNTPLAVACLSKQPQSVMLLLEKSANPNATDFFGYSILHNLIKSHEYNRITHLLIVCPKTNIIIRDLIDYNTPLHVAFRHANKDVVWDLIINGKAVVSIKNKFGEEPLDLLSKEKHSVGKEFDTIIERVALENEIEKMFMEMAKDVEELRENSQIVKENAFPKQKGGLIKMSQPMEVEEYHQIEKLKDNERLVSQTEESSGKESFPTTFFSSINNKPQVFENEPQKKSEVNQDKTKKFSFFDNKPTSGSPEQNNKFSFSDNKPMSGPPEPKSKFSFFDNKPTSGPSEPKSKFSFSLEQKRTSFHQV